MSVRVNQRWPDELHKAVVAAAGVRGVTRFTLDALERALGEQGTSASRLEPVEPYVPASHSFSEPVEDEPEAVKPPAPSRPSPDPSTVQGRAAVSQHVRPAIPKKEK